MIIRGFQHVRKIVLSNTAAHLIILQVTFTEETSQEKKTIYFGPHWLKYRTPTITDSTLRKP